MAVIKVAYIHCRKVDNVMKNGKADTGSKRYLCRNCNKSFQLEYLSNCNKLGTYDRIINMTMHGSGVRDIRRVLKISPTTVIAHLKKFNYTPYLNCLLQKPRLRYTVKWMNSGLLLGTRKIRGGCFMLGSPALRKSLLILLLVELLRR